MKSIYERFTKRTLLTILIVHLTFWCFSATYYVSNAGNDSNSGLTEALAWKTLSKVNAATFVAGDQILFKRSDAWEGTLTVTASGTSGNPIIYGAYGTGENPQIYGSTEITGWTQHSGNIYKATFNTQINQLFINDQRLKIARYPNSGYFDINSVQSTTSFSSSELSGSINYTGASWTGRTSAWATDTKTVTGSTSQMITLNAVPGYNLGVGEGFFLCNKLEFLDSAGEWYYNSTTKTVYLWTINGNSPANYTVRGSVTNDGLYINAKNYVTVENLQFLHNSNNGVNANNCAFLKIDNCDILYPDKIGLLIDNTSSNNNTITNSVINGSNHFGLQVYGSNNSIIDNQVLNIALHENLGISGLGGVNRGIALQVNGGFNYDSPVNNNIIRYNSVIGFGVHGIEFFNATNTIVEYNYLNNGCMLLDDSGAIYSYNADLTKQGCAGSKVRYNIIDQIRGNKDGSTNAKPYGTGIYMDERSRDIIVENNTISGCNGYGVYLHDTKNVNVNNNTIFDSAGGFRVTLTHGGNLFNNNILVNKASTTYGDGTNARATLLNPSHTSTVTMNYNKYVDYHRINTFYRTDTYSELSFSSWKIVTGQDANSKFYEGPALKTGETEQLFYNDTKQDKTFDLGSTTYRDIDGNSVTGKLTLKPFTGKILIGTKFDSTSNDTVNPEITTFTIPATSTSLIVSLSSLSATDNIGVTGYLIAESSTKPLATAPGWSSTKPTTYVFTSVGSKTLYAWAKDAAGNVSLSLQATTVISALAATGFLFTGPSSGNVNSPSASFTVTPNNLYTGTITLTPSGTGSVGLSAKVLTFSNSSTAQTFTITPTVAGSITLTPTNNGTLTNPANLTYTVNAVVPDAPTSVVATSGDASASVTFIAPTNTGGSAITGYTVTSIPAGGTDINAGSTSLTHTITGLTNGTSYMFTVKATNSVGSSIASVASNSIENIIIKQGEIIPSHFTTVWDGLNGLNHMNINVVSALLEDLSLSADDEIAVFSGSACVGASKLTQSIIPSDNTTFVTILASQNDGSGNGFIDNDTIVFKIWNNKTQNELQVNGVVYRNDISTWKTNGRYSPGATTVVEIASYQVYTQSIELLKGYNMISTYVSAQNPNASAVTKTLVDQGNLIKMQDETGNSLENWGDFGGWINKLGSLEKTEGYKIQVANNCTLQVTGRRIAMPLDINLKAGWNIISFPRTDVVNAMNVVQALIDQNKLVKVQDEAGNSIENWGLFGGWKNGIGNFIPGKAYKVKMSADAILSFQESYPKSALVLANSEPTEYYHSSVEGNGTDHMNINITGLNSIGISVGDELAAFDGEICVGTIKITEANLLTGSACLVTSFSTDDQNSNGFNVGNPIQISAWSKLSGDESIVITEVINGQMRYEKNASVLLKMKSATIATVVTNLDDAVKIDVFPNPCQDKVTVRFSDVPEANSRIEISDISGRKLISRHISGTSEEFNLESFTPGLYLVKSILGSSEFVQKLIVNK